MHDQIVEYIEGHFTGHAFARLIGAILRAQGFVTQVAGPGPDGGADILAARGPIGFDPPYMCVQVKSSKKPEDVATLRALQGTMQTFKATQGLLVCWSGFTKALEREARQSFFTIRLWDARDVVEAIYQTYDQLPDDIKAKLPLERVWMLVINDDEE
jgi:restriction system protein